jgi:hypothetical protein
VVANHLKASGNGLLDAADPWDEETRRRDACLLLAEFVETQLPDHRVFIVGDMNDELTDTAPHNVFQNFLDAPASWRFADMAIALGAERRLGRTRAGRATWTTSWSRASCSRRSTPPGP